MLPIRAKDRTLKLLPKCTYDVVDKLYREPFRIIPTALNPPANRVKLRTESALPQLLAAETDKASPNLNTDRQLKLLAMWKKSRTDAASPVRALPNTLMPLASLQKLRMLKLLPAVTKLRVDIWLARRANCRMLKLLPECKKFKTLAAPAILEKARKLQLLPKCSESVIDNLLPNRR
jgi:hypothetical protein